MFAKYDYSMLNKILSFFGIKQLGNWDRGGLRGLLVSRLSIMGFRDSGGCRIIVLGDWVYMIATSKVHVIQSSEPGTIKCFPHSLVQHL